MNRRICLVGAAFLGLVLGVAVFAVLSFNNRGSSKVTVSSFKAESAYAPFPSMVESERLDFEFRNGSSKAGCVELFSIQDENGNWVPSRKMLGDVEARRSTQLYLYLPKGSHPRSLRVRFLMQASEVQKAQVALRVLIDKISGRYPGKTIWFDKMRVPAGEFVVNLLSEAERNGGANGSQPIRSETSTTSSAAGSRR
jgi:hypothetical protein